MTAPRAVFEPKSCRIPVRRCYNSVPGEAVRRLGRLSIRLTHANAAWTPETEAERNAIREQLERILASPLFKKSRRFPNLLRFVVERSLHGHAEPLKERTLGIEVFGREPDYDTNLDPVVRTTAVEIRKRIAQYYHEAGHENEIRIDFPAGSYLPEFRMPEKPAVLAAPVAPSRRKPIRDDRRSGRCGGSAFRRVAGATLGIASCDRSFLGSRSKLCRTCLRLHRRVHHGFASTKH